MRSRGRVDPGLTRLQQAAAVVAAGVDGEVTSLTLSVTTTFAFARRCPRCWSPRRSRSPRLRRYDVDHIGSLGSGSWTPLVSFR